MNKLRVYWCCINAQIAIISFQQNIFLKYPPSLGFALQKILLCKLKFPSGIGLSWPGLP